MSGALVIAARRTPFARLDGQLRDLDAQALAARVVAHLLRDLPADVPVDDVIVANATGPGGNLARRAALDAGCDVATPGMTIDRQCGGGLDAVVLACRLVQAGAGELYVAGGTESASTSPLRERSSPDRGARGRGFFPRNAFSGGGRDDPGMAEAAERAAEEYGVTRGRQDTYAATSHARAVAADRAGRLRPEIVAVRAGTELVASDSCLRPTLTPERLARMPAVTERGTVTAGNASQIADGAAFVLVASERVAARLGVDGLVHRDSATVGVDPGRTVMAAAAAARRLGERIREPMLGTGAHVAMVEAFAAQMCATIDELALDPARVNADGGAIALGHPWAATGAAQVVRLLRVAAPGERCLALAAAAGGMGTAALFERIAR